MKFFTDSSIYQPTYDKHYKVFKDAGGSLDVIRATQGTSFVDDSLDDHYKYNKEVGQRMGLYHWIDPEKTGKANADYFSRQVDIYKDIDILAGDNEQYWTWVSWSNVYEKKIPGAKIVNLPSNQIYDCVAQFFDTMKTRWAPGKTLVEYTAQWFLDNYQKGLNNAKVAEGLLKWLAQYINIGQADLVLTFDQFKTLISTLKSPVLPVGFKEWDAWQISSTIFLPGMPRIDVNIVNPVSKLNTMLDGVIVPPVVVPPVIVPPVETKKYCVNFPNVLCPGQGDYDVVVTSSFLAVCLNPNPTNPLSYVKNGDILVVHEVKDGWGFVSDGWINLSYTKRLV